MSEATGFESKEHTAVLVSKSATGKPPQSKKQRLRSPNKGFPPQSTDTPKDPNIVNWDGPEDPANPRNWTHAIKMMNIALISLSVLSTNISTTMFAPAAGQLARDFGISSGSILETLSITIPSLGAASGPLLFAPLSELVGRVWIYRVTSIVFLGSIVGCARSVDIAMFLVFRFFSGVCSASFMTCGGGTIADLLPKEQRGAATALFSAGPLLGPVLGPVIGGFIVEKLSWRWTFYIVLILGGVVAILNVLLMRETNAKTILEQKTARLRRETGNMDLVPPNTRNLPSRAIVLQALVRPLKMLLKSPIVLLIGLYLAFVFGLTYLLFATFPSVFEKVYGWSVGVTGLAYLGLGIGCAFGVVLFSVLSDKLLNKDSGPERRLLIMMYAGPCIPISLFWYGWTTHAAVHWIVPIIGTGFIGLGIVCVTSSGQLYMMDTFGSQGAASALAALTFIRNSSGAFLALAAPPLYSKLGLGWGNSVLAFIATSFLPVPFLFYHWGKYLRDRFPVKL